MPTVTVTPRVFAAIVGMAAAIAGLIALSIPITGYYTSGMFGNASVPCGSGFVADFDIYSNAPLDACRDAISARRAWGWPLLIVGVVIAAGAMLVEANTRRPASAPADSSD